MKIKAIIFDMDGVLIDAKEWHYHALNDALSIFGYNISRESHLSTFDGLPTKEKLKILSQTSNLPYKLHKLINQLKQKETEVLSFRYCRPNFLHQRALSELYARGYQMALCSNSIRQTVENLMKLSDLDKFLEFKLSNEDVSQGKPSPEMYVKAMDLLSVRPQECLILEDNENGIQAAVASGAHLLKVSEPSDVNLFNIISRIKEIEHA